MEGWRRRFEERVDDDLDMPSALALTWDMVRSELPGQAKLELLLEFDRVFGLGLDMVPGKYTLPDEVQACVTVRDAMRRQPDYPRADQLRNQIGMMGYTLKDTPMGPRLRPTTSMEKREERWQAVSSSKEVDSFLDRPSQVDFSFVVTASNYLEDVKRCAGSILKWAAGYAAELILVDNGSTDGTSEWIDELQRQDPRVRAFHSDHVLGDSAAKNIGLKQSLGRVLIILDTSVEVQGDVLGPIGRRLEDESVGIVGPWGLRSPDLQHFHEEGSGQADGMQLYCIAFHRSGLHRVGLMRETFRFYRNLDLDFSFQFKDQGFGILADDTLPMTRHEHRQWEALEEPERDLLSAKNFKRFLKKWGDRHDLLVSAEAGHHT